MLEWNHRLLNSYQSEYPEQNIDTYSPNIPLRKQTINSDTVIREEADHMHIGGHYFCCTTPKVVPKETDPLLTNSLFGGLVSDADRIKTDFLYTFNIVFEVGLEMKLYANKACRRRAWPMPLRSTLATPLISYSVVSAAVDPPIP